MIIRMSCKILLFSLLTIFSLPAFAQNKTIQGKVTSVEDGKTAGLPGVNILVQGTTKGTNSDADGNYILELTQTENSLTFSFIGYKTQTVSVGNQTVIDVTLEVDAEVLGEVVVVGYGVQRKSDLTGSIGSVRGSDLTKIPSFSAEQALQGKIAGVQVASPSGAPGAAPVIRIRGVGTLNNSSPIFVVDGVILDDITFLNSGDIQSMEVLKDASATAIYGSRGSNGVIIVTTKSGNKGEGVQVSISSEYSLQRLSKQISMLTGEEFAKVLNVLTPGTFNNTSIVPNTNWQDQIFNDWVPIQNHQASLSGTSGKYSFYFGASYFKQDGIISKSSYDRVSIKINNSYAISKSVKVGNNLTIAPDNRQNAADVVPIAYRAWPTSVPYTTDGTFAEVLGAGNPLAANEFNNSSSQRFRAVGNAYIDVSFLKKFLFKSSFGFDLSYGKTKSYTPAFFVSPTQENLTSDLGASRDENKTWLWENTVNYNKTFNKHKFNALAGFTLQKTTSEFLSGSVQNLIGSDPSLWYLNAGETLTGTQRVGNSGSISTIASYLFRTNYSYQDKYLVTVSARIDGSSKFGKSNLYGTYPSFALGWNLLNESFMPASRIVSNVKLRASWGIVGNEKINGDSRFSLVANSQNAVFGLVEQVQQGATLGSTAQPNLRWESTTQTDIGLELGFWDDKLTAELDYYSRVTDDILVGLATPGHVGNGAFVRVITNAASVLNRGVELTLAWNDQIGQVKYKIGGVASTVHNEVLNLGASSGSDSFISAGDLGNGQLVTRTQVGKPIGSFYGYQVIGIFQNQTELDTSPKLSGQEIGDLRYADNNKDGLINADDRTYIGSPIPSFIFGFNSEFSYKSFDLSLDFQGQSGNKIYNGKMAVRPDLYNFEARVKNYWRGEGTSNVEPRPTAGGVNYEQSTYFIEDGSYLRLRNIRIGYNFPVLLIKKLGLTNARAYLSGTNIFTLTKYSGFTPEIGGSDGFSSGIDLGIYPITAVYSVGVNVTF
jgi:TonB-linked SusC/RagA family outer membrane protein